MIVDEKLKTILAEIFGLRAEDIHPDLKREDVGSWDSLKQMDMVMSLEREYSMTLEIAEIIKMMSVADVIEVLQDKGVKFGN